MNLILIRITPETLIMMRHLASLLILVLLSSCGKESILPKVGHWRASLDLGEGKELPFMIDYTEENIMLIKNADEEIVVSDIEIDGDSITIRMPVFEGVLKGVFTETKISGDFIKASLNRVVPFQMVFGQENRFESNEIPLVTIDGNWETVFSPNASEDRYIAKGIFEQDGEKLTGTFRTTTGDYRYLEGIVVGDSMKLSTFDGAHAFLFEAKITDSLMNGVFYSGNHFQEPFIARPNQSYELPAADSLTFLKEGYDRVEFSFPDAQGDLVSLNDARFKDKVVLVQIMGTWCPNCLDETRFYSEYYKNLKSDDLEIVALAFEYAPTEERAWSSINRLIDGAGITYPVLLAQYGSSSKTKANEKLPMLNHVLSYPTTIYIDKAGKVRKIHTGFNGPATGEKYEDFVVDFEHFVHDLLDE
jgi:peroxiredoxin